MGLDDYKGLVLCVEALSGDAFSFKEPQSVHKEDDILTIRDKNANLVCVNLNNIILWGFRPIIEGEPNTPLQ